MDGSSLSSSETQVRAHHQPHQQAQQQKPQPAQQQAQQQAHEQVRQQPQYASRNEIRRAIYGIVRGILLRHLEARAGRPVRVPGELRARLRRRSRALEDLLYRRALTMEEYQDPGTLERRIRGAGRVIFARRQQRTMEAESRRRLAVAARIEAARLELRRLRGFR